MGPKNNGELFETHGLPRVAAIDAEIERRDLLSKVIAELSQLLEDLQEPYRDATEPTLFLRLLTLLKLKHTPVSIAGFYESNRAFLLEKGMVQAKAAPHHDEYKSEDNTKEYRTRVIQFKMATPENTDLEIFGINIYQPQPDIQVPGLEEESKPNSDPAAEAYRALRGKSNQESIDTSPITGQTVLIVMRNKKTNDANVYSIRFVTKKEEDSIDFEHEKEGSPDSISLSEGKDYVSINGNGVLVEALAGTMLHQAVFEIQTANQKLRELKEKKKEETEPSPKE